MTENGATNDQQALALVVGILAARRFFWLLDERRSSYYFRLLSRASQKLRKKETLSNPRSCI